MKDKLSLLHSSLQSLAAHRKRSARARGKRLPSVFQRWLHREMQASSRQQGRIARKLQIVKKKSQKFPMLNYFA